MGTTFSIHGLLFDADTLARAAGGVAPERDPSTRAFAGLPRGREFCALRADGGLWFCAPYGDAVVLVAPIGADDWATLPWFAGGASGSG